jgi:hypothetical protein
MDTRKLRKFASFARSALIEQVATRLKTVLAEKSLARRESPKAVGELEAKIKEIGEKRLVETVAYTWFNRFCALRYMDVNRYTRIGVLSPADGQFQPEILAEAKMGHIDEDLVPEATRKQVMRLLDGSDKSADSQGEAYRLLLVAVCNYYHALMPFMFEKIADYTELLLPDDLLSGASIPAYTREALLPLNCSPEHTEESVEIIGWLYQFYIADKKDQVFEGFKKGKKITAENIPAATQLFTPHWIVRYLVENSLGRLWMLNHPDSKLIERMDYYIRPEKTETDFLKISGPEEIMVCDPACGSGHMLTYAFDLLYEIYREEQYAEPEIPSLILRNNLFGIEIDPRAGALAAFALTMKAREKDKRLFTRKPIQNQKSQNQNQTIQNPNICVLENISIDPEDLAAYMDKVGCDLLSGGLKRVLNQWEEADNFGSLIRPLVTDVSDVLELLSERQMGQDLFLAGVHQKVLKALRQADYLSPKYHVVVANPPYIGKRNLGPSLRKFLSDHYESYKSDVFAAFIVRNSELGVSGAALGYMTPYVWMFLSTYEELRTFLVSTKTITSLIQLEYSGFDGATVPICTFTLDNCLRDDFIGQYISLSEFRGSENQGPKSLEAISDPNCNWRFSAEAKQFAALPGSPIAYWLSEGEIRLFIDLPSVGSQESVNAAVGLFTCDNERFLRRWFEVSFKSICFSADSGEAESCQPWRPYIKGGAYRRWYGNLEWVVFFPDNGQAIRDYRKASGQSWTLPGEDNYFKEGISWTDLTSGLLSVRYMPRGCVYDVAGHSATFHSNAILKLMLGYMNTPIVERLSKAINMTFHFQVGDFKRLPFPPANSTVGSLVDECVEIARNDWDSAEVSWGFTRSPFFADDVKGQKFIDSLTNWAALTERRIDRLKHLEESCNQTFIDTLGLSDDLSPVVIEDAVELRRGEQTQDAQSFISYAVGCMLGRYSLDKPGLIIANQGETASDYRQQIPEPTFAPDEDNVLPLLGGDWFTDGITERFKGFLKVTFGNEHYEANLKVLEDALYPDNLTAKKRKTIRDYFLKDFYNHHIKLYKKRPIYWLFSSPKGTFNALIYMHRYRPDTVGTVLHCLRDFRDKLTHHAEHQQMLADSARASKFEKTQAIKDVAAIKKQLKELEDYEKTLFEVAARKIDIDLDDGVKHNYLLFGSVLRKIPGLDAKDD